ncbi:hypothetical protein DASC09_003890 [Saccharomycopsis crataegensis]|uniref:Uncharacterized protein n=1 Tax=Saccharomycopsis crataegensis TaxID=43959 RepID=A0AAV5QEH7_9ASCO|nr:hypothetical protein DASC09_003890 [Saccharomycopsis crataegensis]
MHFDQTDRSAGYYKSRAKFSLQKPTTNPPTNHETSVGIPSAARSRAELNQYKIPTASDHVQDDNMMLQDTLKLENKYLEKEEENRHLKSLGTKIYNRKLNRSHWH